MYLGLRSVAGRRPRSTPGCHSAPGGAFYMRNIGQSRLRPKAALVNRKAVAGLRWKMAYYPVSPPANGTGLETALRGHAAPCRPKSMSSDTGSGTTRRCLAQPCGLAVKQLCSSPLALRRCFLRRRTRGNLGPHRRQVLGQRANVNILLWEGDLNSRVSESTFDLYVQLVLDCGISCRVTEGRHVVPDRVCWNQTT